MSRLLLIVAGAATAGAYVIPSLAATPRTRTRALRCAESSPFEGDDAPSTSSSASATLDFTVENVDKTLDEVRPYLISDGGNVKVVSVDPESFGVQLQLQGACGSCPSSTTTMKMGIERILKEQWPSLGDVVDIGGGEESVEPKELTIQTAHDALETIMPAIAGLGGSVRIVEAIAAESKIVLEYTGPEKIKFGIELALKDSPLIDTVEFL